MSDLWSYDYSGGAFVQGGAAHLGAVAVLIILAIVGWRIKFSPLQRQIVRWGMAGVLFLNEALWHVWHVDHGIWTVQELLPLELCSLMVFASAWALITKSQLVYEFVYLLGIPAASQIMFTPALGRYGYPHFLFIQQFVSHGCILLTALYLTLGEHMRPRSWGAVARVAGLTMLYALGIFFLNFQLNSNYLFLAYKPPAETLINYLGPWPWYGFSMAAIGLVLAFLLYLPFAIRDRRTEQQVSSF